MPHSKATEIEITATRILGSLRSHWCQAHGPKRVLDAQLTADGWVVVCPFGKEGSDCCIDRVSVVITEIV